MSAEHVTRTGTEKKRCEQCGKWVGGLRQHRKDVHGSPKRLKLRPGNIIVKIGEPGPLLVHPLDAW